MSFYPIEISFPYLAFNKNPEIPNPVLVTILEIESDFFAAYSISKEIS